MGFIGDLARWAFLIFIIVAFFTASSFAIASAFIIPQDLPQDTDVVAELSTDAQTTATVVAESVRQTPSTAMAPQPSATEPPVVAAPRAIDGIPPELDTSIGTVTCRRPDDPASANDPFVLTITGISDDPEPVIVAVDLALSDGRRERRTVEAAGVVPIEVVVPQSGGSAYIGCSVVALQQGDQVVRFAG